jgi:hypothetical protein
MQGETPLSIFASGRLSLAARRALTKGEREFLQFLFFLPVRLLVLWE